MPAGATTCRHRPWPQSVQVRRAVRGQARRRAGAGRRRFPDLHDRHRRIGGKPTRLPAAAALRLLRQGVRI